MSNQYLEIVPSNITSDGKLSFRNGQPVIQFIIGEQQRYLLGQSIRLTGNFSVLSAPDALGSDEATLSMDGKTSLYSTIDQLVIKSQSTNQTIEHIRNYNRFMASYLGAVNDLGDGLSHKNQDDLQVLNSKAIKSAVVDNPVNRGTLGSSTFALTLPCGLFNGTQNIPLAKEWGLGGLLIEIHLASDSNVLFANDGATDISTAFYEYKNMNLCCEVQTPPADELSKLQSSGAKGNTFEYNSISSYYTTINAANAIINFSLGLSKVLSVFCNFITASAINNRLRNGMLTSYNRNGTNKVAYVKSLVFTRGGERMPLEYNIDTVQKVDSTNRNPDGQIIRNYVNAIHSFSKNRRNLLKPENMVLPGDSTNVVDYDQKVIDGGSNYGIGVAFDMISNQGVDFSSTNFGINMDLDLITDNPQAVYMFVHHKNTVVFNQSGIQVLN
jgi:hypothetical protein